MTVGKWKGSVRCGREVDLIAALWAIKSPSGFPEFGHSGVSILLRKRPLQLSLCQVVVSHLLPQSVCCLVAGAVALHNGVTAAYGSRNVEIRFSAVSIQLSATGKTGFTDVWL